MSLIQIDRYQFFSLHSEKEGANMLQTLISLKKYNTNIDDVKLKRRNLEPKKWSLNDMVRLYSSGVL